MVTLWSPFYFNTAHFGNDITILKQAILANPTHFSKYPELIELANLKKEDAFITLLHEKNINFAKTTDSVQPYNFKAAVTLGSTDYEEIKRITNVPTATLLPSCDGDIEDLHAAMTFDNNRFLLQHDSLTFRVALPLDIGQEIYVELTDLEGKTARVTASDFTDALFIIPRKKQNGIPLQVLPEDEKYSATTSEALNMVSIPLKAFKGINTDYLKTLKFIFPKEKGRIAMNDIQLQKLRS